MEDVHRLGYPYEFFDRRFEVKRFRVRGRAVRRCLDARSRGTTPNDVMSIKFQPLQFRKARRHLEFREWFPVTYWMWIRRGDRLGQAISLEIAIQTDAWASAVPESRAPVYSCNAIRRRMAAIETDDRAWLDFFQANGIDPLIVRYEELIAAPQRVIRSIADFIGEPLPAVPPDGPARRKHSPDLEMQRNERSAEWRRRFLAETQPDTVRMRGLGRGA